MIITDGLAKVEITMKTWTADGYAPDWSNDFFNAGTLEHFQDDAGNIVYKVPDVNYCIGQAKDWENNRGDFYGDEEDPDNKLVKVRDLLMPFSDLNYN